MSQMRPAERDLLLMVLAVTAGSADAWSYFGLSHSFVANMTGNTVLIGVALTTQNRDFVHPLISLASYALGVIAGALLTRRVKPDGLWSRAVSWTLLVEAGLITASAFGWAILRGTNAQAMLERNVLLGWIAAAIGIQSGAMLRLKIPGIVTTYITGTWTNLMSGVARLTTGEAPASEGGKKRFEERLLLQAGVLACYLLSAVIAGWLLGHLPQAAGGLTAASVCFAAIYGLVRS
jgi:uncharacterized membrane protein YoaK (UPF0700 family)